MFQLHQCCSYFNEGYIGCGPNQLRTPLPRSVTFCITEPVALLSFAKVSKHFSIDLTSDELKMLLTSMFSSLHVTSLVDSKHTVIP